MSDQPGRADFSRLYRTILDELGTGRYRAGQRLGVKEMADRLHVSPTPIRELMSRLVGRGVIEERRSEGYYLSRLEVRDIADLYRLHGQCTDLAIRELPWPPVPLDPMPGDGWSIITCLVDQTGNLILRDARAYLGDRLRVIRHFEDLAIDGIAAESDDLARLCTAPDRALLRRAVARFYKRRIAAAPGLALLLGRA
jgi:DNA-binding Lrp family transcriptional regulator